MKQIVSIFKISLSNGTQLMASLKLFKNSFRFFRNKRQAQIFGLLCLSSFFDCLLVAYRSYYIDFHFDIIQSPRDLFHTRGVYGTFSFLIWNLFLAWIPYLIALVLVFFDRRYPPSSLKGILSAKKESCGQRKPLDWTVFWIIGLLTAWLLFFPNAPYLVTDLLHLQNRFVVPHWYDVMVFTAFAWTGLLLGFCSLAIVQAYLGQYLNHFWIQGLSFFAIVLGGFGVYMGRFQRWNSWDILDDPLQILRQQVHVLRHYDQYLNTLGMSVVMAGFLLTSYWTLQVLARADKSA
jgi:uncharacterized membrane protein